MNACGCRPAALQERGVAQRAARERSAERSSRAQRSTLRSALLIVSCCAVAAENARASSNSAAAPVARGRAMAGAAGTEQWRRVSAGLLL